MEARNLVDVFGWNLPFRRETLDVEMLALMAAGRILQARGDLFVSTLRVASVKALLFLHSAFPTDDRDAVFFGPDSYRFTDFIRAEAPALAPAVAQPQQFMCMPQRRWVGFRGRGLSLLELT